MSDSLQPHGLEPIRLLCSWDYPGKNRGVGSHFLLQCMKVKVKLLSHVWLLATPWTAACQAPPSMGVSNSTGVGCLLWKKAECWRIAAFQLWCWRRFLRVPGTARRSNQSILKEINPEYLLEGLMLKLKLQYFGHLIRSTDSLEKTLMLGKTEGRRRRGWQDELVGWHHWLNGHESEQTLGDGEGQGRPVCCSPWGCKKSDMT